MADMDLAALSKAMAKIDFAMMTTRTEQGALASRPMSNNGEVEYKGSSFFFSWNDARTVSDIESDAHVSLNFTGSAGPAGLLGRPPLFIAVEGRAALIRDKARFAQHWRKDLDRWFEQGPDTPGVVMIEVRADRIHYWDGNDQGDLTP